MHEFKDQSDEKLAADPSIRMVRRCPQCQLDVSSSLSECPIDGCSLIDLSIDSVHLPAQYQLVSVIGSGGMGVVYHAYQPLIDRHVAIKMLPTSHLAPSLMQRLQQEAKAASRLDHPNIISVHDFGIMESGQPYLIMDFVRGQTLAHYLRYHGSLALEQFEPILLQICDALIHAHANGILHRDLKPSNIMLADQVGNGVSIKLLDFGVAKFLKDETQSTLTRTGDIIGSPLYMSPEQAQGSKLDQRSDIYSLGCVIYECLTGQAPHVGDNVIATLMKHQTEPVLSLREATLGKNFPKWLEFVVAKSLAKAPDQRFQSVQELKNALMEKMLPSAAAPKAVAPGSSKPYQILGLTSIIVVALFAVIMFNLGSPPRTPRETNHRASVQPLDNTPEAPGDDDVALEKAASVTGGMQIFDLDFWARVTPSGLRVLRYCRNLIEVKAEGCAGRTGMADALAQAVVRMPIRKVEFDDSGLTNIGLSALGQLPYVAELDISNNPNISDAGFGSFDNSKSIIDLRVRNCANLNGQFLRHLKNSPLEKIDLVGTRLNDRDFLTLAGKKGLRLLKIDEGSVSPQAAQRFHRSLPRCDLYMKPRSSPMDRGTD